ncbi:PDZ domain-containing protein [Flavilitoribacter nigricans]|uniref:PDZ domain-containing protein n=1 Tax=Flavilitoribacter nigricans (strain ATCC 23147 / DSM 23189 / NBRC 102662 / NCIMB 1420 / SS-2) TaxID=1122177 RepID=A0A2D0NFI0_FLAN2|nr:PDZ domain-containing protein [Flavilitoribacter nigricans]PHN07245.1 hypothetical protein CRP01_06345 [Flavilitoribacter nigricans DSM 23189 = NBRC 102662]
MRSFRLITLGSLVLSFLLVANFSYGQQKQDKQKEESPKKVIIIKKAKDGEIKTERIVTDGEELHEIRLDGQDGKVIVKEIEGDGEKQIKVIVNPDVDGVEVEQNVDVQIETINGEKHVNVKVMPLNGEAKTFVWKGEGEIPADVREKLEADGIFIHESGENELDGENIFFYRGDDTGNFEWNSIDDEGGPFLGVTSAVESKVTVVVDENGETQTVDTSGEEEDVDGVRIGEVIEGSAAAEAGLKEGDILKAIDGRQLEDFNDLVDFMKDAEIGQKVNLSYERDGQLNTAEATLQERQAGMGQNVIIERIIENGDKEGNAFFFRTEDGDGAKLHQRHKIVVITRGDSSEDAQEGEATFFEEDLPEVELKRDLDLRNYKLFPNPTDGNLQLRFQADALPTEIKISDLNGKQMYRERLNQFDGAYDQRIDLTDLPAGSFILTIEQADKVYTEQIILK